MKKNLLLLSFFAATFSFAQNCSELFISEYVEGSGNNKALEIYNPTASAIDLSGYRIERFSNGSGTSASGGILNLSGSIAANSAFVIANGQITTSPSSPACDPILQAMADQLDGVYPAPTYMNGNDAIALFHGSIMIDLLGKIADASMTSSSGWGDVFPYDGSVGAVWTENHTLVRKASVQIGVSANPSSFIVSNEWDTLPQNTWSNLGTHVCISQTLNLMPYTYDTTTITATETYTWSANNLAYTSSGIYTGPSTANCVKQYLNLTINSSGISEEELEFFSLYPNPVSDMLNVNLNVQSNEDYLIIDNFGSVVKRGFIGNLSNEISVSHLSAGLYYFKIEGTKPQKFSKID